MSKAGATRWSGEGSQEIVKTKTSERLFPLMWQSKNCAVIVYCINCAVRKFICSKKCGHLSGPFKSFLMLTKSRGPLIALKDNNVLGSFVFYIS